MAKDRHSLGYAQPLGPVTYSHRPGSAPAYPLEAQRQRMAPQIQQMLADASAVPPILTAEGHVVAIVRLHSRALSRSANPQALLKRADLRLLGSRVDWIAPEKERTNDVGSVEELTDDLFGPGDAADSRNALKQTTDLFVAGTPNKMRRLLPLLMDRKLKENTRIVTDLRNLEAIRLMSGSDRITPGVPDQSSNVELVLHYDNRLDAAWYDKFASLAASLGVELHTSLAIPVRGLLFMPADAPRGALEELAQFTFLRAIRPLPKWTPLETPQLLRSAGQHAILPTQPVFNHNRDIRA